MWKTEDLLIKRSGFRHAPGAPGQAPIFDAGQQKERMRKNEELLIKRSGDQEEPTTNLGAQRRIPPRQG